MAQTSSTPVALLSLGDLQSASYSAFAAQAQAPALGLVQAWLDIQAKEHAQPPRFRDLAELLYAHRGQLVAETRLFAWQVVQFMTFGPLGGAFGFGDGGRGVGIMAALARDMDAGEHNPDANDPAVDERWAPIPPPGAAISMPVPPSSQED